MVTHPSPAFDLVGALVYRQTLTNQTRNQPGQPVMDTHDYCELYIEMPDGALGVWAIGASFERDTPESLQQHLAKWIPGAKLMGFRFGLPSQWQDSESDRRLTRNTL